jgi:hypothetical protein
MISVEMVQEIWCVGGAVCSWGRCFGYTVEEVVCCFGYCDVGLYCGRWKGEYGTYMQYRIYFGVLFLMGVECEMRQRKSQVSPLSSLPSSGIIFRKKEKLPLESLQFICLPLTNVLNTMIIHGIDNCCEFLFTRFRGSKLSSQHGIPGNCYCTHFIPPINIVN